MRKKLLIALFIASILAPNFLYAALKDRLDTSSTCLLYTSRCV